MTLVAAWKLPDYDYGHNNPCIRVISDSMLSRTPGDAINDEWDKIHVITPKIKIPISSCDEEWSESFNHLQTRELRPFGIFFAGSIIPFNYLLDKARTTIESLGLRAEYKNGEHARTFVVREHLADRFNNFDSMTGAVYSPPPPLNMQFVAELMREELQAFYTPESNRFITGPGYREIKYKVDVGVAGFCDQTQKYRIFALNLADHFNEDEPQESTLEVIMREIADDELLLFGPTPLLEQIKTNISGTIGSDTTASAEVAEQLSLIRQSVVETAISSGATPGVGGRIQRGEVTSERGFQMVSSSWVPPENWDFSKWDWG